MGKKPDIEAITQGIAGELRRGVVTAAVLSRLGTSRYGYTLQKELDAAGLPVDQNTLYPMLRRLESQGLLKSEWKVEDQRPRRYYERTELGNAVLKGLKAELRTQRKILEEIGNGT